MENWRNPCPRPRPPEVEAEIRRSPRRRHDAASGPTNCPRKTGRSLDQWAKFINNSGIDGRQERIAFLKDEHGLGTNSAWFIVDYAADKHSWDGDPEVYLEQAVQYVEDQYAGPKATLRPIFEKVLAGRGNSART